MIDCLALGEVMLRFDPGDLRICNTDRFRVWEGGGEYNVARGLANCFGRQTAMVTALVDNPIGRLIESRMAAGKVKTEFIRWLPDDGIGHSCRNGIYFLERGFGERPPLGMSDRGNTAISQLKPRDIDWQWLFATYDIRWLHTGGIMAGLSTFAPEVILEAIEAAHQHGATVSYDLNYRPSLWQRFGGKKAADTVNARILPHVDVLFGVDHLDSIPFDLDPEPFRRAILRMVGQYQNLKTVATTIRIVKTANCHDWSGLLWHQNSLFLGRSFANQAIYDRVGGGDAFAAGIIYGLLQGLDGQKILDYGVIHGLLTMTTPGDNSMFLLSELEKFIIADKPSLFR